MAKRSVPQKQVAQPPSPSPSPSPSPEALIRQQMRLRFWRTLNYLSIFTSCLVVYGSAVVADYLLFLLIWALMGDTMTQHPIVVQAADFTQIGLALMALFGMLVHGVFSAWGQIQLDLKLSREGEDDI